ncbi:MAG: SDR family oxidoreductase [Endomicrobiaceae bacterium]|nr:SDR family oxidoreductase [Endomicrobiaceae bacterium]
MKKYALVTGGSRGIGAAIATELAKNGYNILLNYLSNDVAANKVCENIVKLNVQCELLKFDVSNYNDVKTNLQNIVQDSQICILINNACNVQNIKFVDLKNEQWNNQINTVLGGFFNTTSIILPNMLKNNFGRIINISSVNAFAINGNVAYTAAKLGLVGASKALARELLKTNITVNTVVPGIIYTDNWKKYKTKEEIMQMVPMNRVGEPQDIANAVSFLVSDKSNYITGQEIHVNGGMYM